MRNLLNPRWLFVINTLPVLILYFILWNQYSIIHSLLSEENILLWQRFGLTLALMTIAQFLYAGFLVTRKKEIPVLYAILTMVFHIAFLYVYGIYTNKILPFNIPDWMLSGNVVLYVGTFLMPTLAYAMFVLVTHFTPEDKPHKAWKNFFAAFSVPASWYLFVQLILPFWRNTVLDFLTHFFIVLIVTSTLIFLFFLIRGIYIIVLKKVGFWQKYQLLWKIPVALLFPLLGLAINEGDFASYKYSSGIFGNFSSPWFYILAAVNGILICMPSLENKLYRTLLFTARCMLFGYTFYFFLVFLPFLPLSVMMIIAAGTGFLMLTPLVLFILHIYTLNEDFTFLKNHVSGNIFKSIIVLGTMFLPLCLTAVYMRDKMTLNEALDYIYKPDYSKKYSIDGSSLFYTLDVIKKHKERNNDDFFGIHTPYLSSYFNWLVLDNMTLSDTKINTISNVFFGEKPFEVRSEPIRNDSVKISKVQTDSRYDATQQAWISWINLEITNYHDRNWFSEYSTTFELPEGCWISDYYLYVGDKKEKGILAEKKSAMWVFSQIQNENRDPGILYYQTGNKVAFKVFPFLGNEKRKTGIELIHKEPIKLTIDDRVIELGDFRTEQMSLSENKNNNVAYVSAVEKSRLKEVQRKPYYHFLVDVSKNNNTPKENFINRIKYLLSKNRIPQENARISFVNTYISTFPLENWEEKYQAQDSSGGFYLDRAIRTALFQSYKSKELSYPIMVVLSDNIEQAIIEKDFSDLKNTYPETDWFYTLNEHDQLISHSLKNDPLTPLTEVSDFDIEQKVLAYPEEKNILAYLPVNGEADIVLLKDVFEVDEKEIKEKNWESALIIQGKWMSQILHPETSEESWLPLVKYSFMSKIMNPFTSYLVVENEAQKAMLKKKQEQVLSGNSSLDPGEDLQRMTEPGIFLIAALFLIIIYIKEKRKSSQADIEKY